MAVDDDARAGDAFPTKAKAGWQKYVQRVTRYEAAVRTQLTNVLTGEVRMTSRGNLAMSGNWARSSGSGSGEFVRGSSASAHGINSMYSFSLVRESEDADWRLDRLKWNAQDATANGLEELALAPDHPVPWGAEVQTVWQSVMRRVCNGLMLDNIWFPSMMESTDFALQSVETVESAGRTLVRVQFAYLPSKLDIRVRDGFVLLDPDQSWMICEARTKGEWGFDECDQGQIIIRNEFDTSLDGLPLLAHHQMHWIGTTEEGEPSHHVSELWLDNWQHSSRDETDYRLPAFGLPDLQPP